ncbi:DUF4286 family protein [Arcticibacterium luteifluviistationis]|uniref:DUF4286 family protein n=1 Tax=Arcticibacterium luteifluviistationis TaxID=1784714 RepID=UPI0013A6AC41|nr:DUF4286 family protein [Arcticibacterium luteifluviistationis]
MILSSFTFSIEYSHALLFENSLNTEIVPFLNSLEEVKSLKLYKLITDIETGGQNLSLQIFLENMDKHKSIEANHKAKILSILDAKFAGKYVYFQSLLEEI